MYFIFFRIFDMPWLIMLYPFCGLLGWTCSLFMCWFMYSNSVLEAEYFGWNWKKLEKFCDIHKALDIKFVDGICSSKKLSREWPIKTVVSGDLSAPSFLSWSVFLIQTILYNLISRAWLAKLEREEKVWIWL